jgi:hypothetical protein
MWDVGWEKGIGHREKQLAAGSGQNATKNYELGTRHQKEGDRRQNSGEKHKHKSTSSY